MCAAEFSTTLTISQLMLRARSCLYCALVIPETSAHATASAALPASSPVFHALLVSGSAPHSRSRQSHLTINAERWMYVQLAAHLIRNLADSPTSIFFECAVPSALVGSLQDRHSHSATCSSPITRAARIGVVAFMKRAKWEGRCPFAR